MTIEIEIKESNPFKAKTIKNQLQALSALNQDVLPKLVEFSKNEKAIAMFIENYEHLKNM